MKAQEHSAVAHTIHDVLKEKEIHELLGRKGQDDLAIAIAEKLERQYKMSLGNRNHVTPPDIMVRV